MSEKVDITKLHQLITDAQAASEELENKKEAERSASHEWTVAKERAVKAWNSIYHLLCDISKENERDEAFKSSKLYSLINPEKVTKRVVSE